MPMYDYECKSCGHRFELSQKMSAPHVKKCPSCKKENVKRLIGSGGGFIFKGSGFYATDYKKSGSGKKPGKSCDAGGSKKDCSSCPHSH